MSLFKGSVRPPAVLSDEAIERYLDSIRAELEPDPLFRRRLRGHLVNRFVAAREGHGTSPGSTRRDMGRLGRGVLYASFTLGVGITGVMGASQRSIPGDVFYPLKLQIEELRARALPAHFQDELAAYNLGQRIEELSRLAESGQWSRVTAHATAVEHAYAAMVAASGELPVRRANLAIITALMDQLPDDTRVAVESAMGGMPGIGQDVAPGRSGPDAAGGSSGRDPDSAVRDGSNADGRAHPGASDQDGSTGNRSGQPPVTNHGSGADPARGGPAATAAPDSEDGETPSDESEPTKTPKPTKSAKPTPTPDDEES